MAGRLEGKRCIVSGGTKGIGRAVVETLPRRGRPCPGDSPQGAGAPLPRPSGPCLPARRRLRRSPCRRPGRRLCRPLRRPRRRRQQRRHPDREDDRRHHRGGMGPHLRGQREEHVPAVPRRPGADDAGRRRRHRQRRLLRRLRRRSGAGRLQRDQGRGPCPIARHRRRPWRPGHPLQRDLPGLDQDRHDGRLSGERPRPGRGGQAARRQPADRTHRTAR